MTEFEKRKKKYDADQTSSDNGSSGFTPTINHKDELGEYEHKKKKDYDYETLFDKPAAETPEDRLKQAFITSQAYRSISTSGSRTSLEADTPEITSNSSVGSGSNKALPANLKGVRD